MKIFICSPYQGNIEENKKKAAYYAKIVAKAGNVPVAPHIYFPTFLDEKNPNERSLLDVILTGVLSEVREMKCMEYRQLKEGEKDGKCHSVFE